MLDLLLRKRLLSLTPKPRPLFLGAAADLTGVAGVSWARLVVEEGFRTYPTILGAELSMESDGIEFVAITDFPCSQNSPLTSPRP